MTVIKLKNNESEYFSLINYPDGQNHLILHLDKLDIKELIEIECRIKTFADLEILSLLVMTLHKYDFMIETIRYMYLFGMRSDRAFEKGQCNYFKTIVAPMLNFINEDCRYREVLVPHSIASMRCIRNANICKSENLYEGLSKENADKIRIYGDKSADNFIDYDLCQGFHFDKVRTISGIRVSLTDAMLDHIEKETRGLPILIVDDMCDGGATFIAEAIYLKEKFPDRKLHLFVVHGIFSKGFDELFKYFDKIITTNSYQDFNEPLDGRLKIIEVI